MGSNPPALHINFFSFKIEETCTFINDFQLETSSTLCKSHKGRKCLSTDVNEC